MSPFVFQIFQDLRVFNLDEMLVCSSARLVRNFLSPSLSVRTVGTVADAGGRGGRQYGTPILRTVS